VTAATLEDAPQWPPGKPTWDSSFEDYDRTDVTFESGTWDTEHAVNSEANAQAAIKDDYDVDMQWRYQVKSPNGTDEWISTGDVNNLRYYLIWDDPTAPQTKPWNGVLEKAVDWAEGKSSAADAVDAVMKAIYSDVGGSYDTVSGAPRYCDSPAATTGTFNLTSLLSAMPSIGTVNCYDCGKALTAFGNALGCGLSYRFTNPFGYLNCVKPIGKGWTNNPFYDAGAPISSEPIVGEDDDYADGRSSFGNHAFAGIGTSFYDACMKVDTDANPDAAPHTESWLSGVSQSNYLTMVIDDNPASSPGTPTSHSFSVR